MHIPNGAHMSASPHRATELKHLPGMKAESGSVVGTDKVKTPPVLKLAVLEIKPQGKKHSVIQRLLPCQKPEDNRYLTIANPNYKSYDLKQAGKDYTCELRKIQTLD
ncbi:hypothetical protein E5288_WYG019890 [Bos mutus]|uniref:Uncharacterized protein n=1 Tax=Bos mutus TaxID=72004 RepID=A0A6B0RRH1_9CETA|nr:hypothetical protein [Bos mutus]